MQRRLHLLYRSLQHYVNLNKKTVSSWPCSGIHVKQLQVMLQVILAIQSCHVGVPEMGCRDAPFQVCYTWDHRSQSKPLELESQPGSSSSSTEWPGEAAALSAAEQKWQSLFPCSWWKDQLNNVKHTMNSYGAPVYWWSKPQNTHATKVCFNILKK